MKTNRYPLGEMTLEEFADLPGTWREVGEPVKGLQTWRRGYWVYDPESGECRGVKDERLTVKVVNVKEEENRP